MSYDEGHRLTRKRSYAPRRDINEVRALLGVMEAEQEARNLTKEPPNGKEKYKGNGNHAWEIVTQDDGKFTSRLRVPGGWLYSVSFSNSYDLKSDSHTVTFVPLPAAIGYSV